MQNSAALFGMVSHCQTQSFADFTGLALSVYGGKTDICSRRAGNGAFGAQICRSPHDTPTHMSCASMKRLGAIEEKAHLSARAPRSCFSLPPAQGKIRRSKSDQERAFLIDDALVTERLIEIQVFFILLKAETQFLSSSSSCLANLTN